MKMTPLRKNYLILIVINLSILMIITYFYSRANGSSLNKNTNRRTEENIQVQEVTQAKQQTQQTQTPKMGLNYSYSVPTVQQGQSQHPPHFKYENYDISQPEIFRMEDDNKVYFQTIGNWTCFIEGTDWEATLRNGNCTCQTHWYSEDCGIPYVVWKSISDSPFNVSRRSKPRRVINAINVNHEFEMMEGRVHELGDVVDVYLIGESNYTAYGNGKPLNFLEKFRNGYLKEFQQKFVYVFQNEFPLAGRIDGWIADDFQRTFLSKQGLKQLKGLESDDIYLQSDADEIPKREGILFLKLYENYPQPIKLSLTWTNFGFFWFTSDINTVVIAACSVEMLKSKFEMDGINLRRDKPSPESEIPYTPWTIGDFETPAGWHCSWCFLSEEGIRTKLLSAQNGDTPRWGDYPEKIELDYLKSLIETGTWFDDQTRFTVRTPIHDYAPKYYLHNLERFLPILLYPNNTKFTTT